MTQLKTAIQKPVYKTLKVGHVILITIGFILLFPLVGFLKTKFNSKKRK